jgi:hypothetical protein
LAARDAFIRNANTHSSPLISVAVPASSGVAIPTDTKRFAGIEYNAGSPQWVIKTTDTWTTHDDFPMGLIVNEGGTLHILNDPFLVANPAAHIMERFYATGRFARDDTVGGGILGETGTRNVTVSATTFWSRLSEFPYTAKDTSGADTFDSYSSGGLETTGDTQWPNTQYDNAGTLTTMTNNWYANLWFYAEMDDDLVMVYGTTQSSSVAGALEEGAPTVLPDRIQTHGRLLGRIVFKKSGATAEDIESVFETTLSATGATSHNQLASLQGGASGEYFHLTTNQHTAVNKGQMTITFDGGGSALTTGAKKVYIAAPHAGTITDATLLADQSGSIVIDVWKDTYANFPPTVADTITAAAKPTLSAAQKSQDSTLTGWTTAFAEGDVFEFNIDSVVTITKAILTLDYSMGA